jgi:hypothetical protein
MADTTITSSNAVLHLTVSGLFNTPVKMLDWSSEKAFLFTPLQLAETRMTLDGRLTGGHIKKTTEQTISLTADSRSKYFFSTLLSATKVKGDIFYLGGDLVLPATGENFVLTRGILTTVQQIPGAQKVLEDMDFIIEWESVQQSLV